jgi:DNA-binding NarL/FixJ family response regulator
MTMARKALRSISWSPPPESLAALRASATLRLGVVSDLGTGDALAALIGRRHEVDLLVNALEVARGGRGGLVLLVGEAGIGKTRLAEALADHARDTGATVLWGACLEDDWRPSHGPWVEALDAYLRELDPLLLPRMLGQHAAPLARLLPGLRAARPDVDDPASLPADEERIRLYVAVAQLLLAAAQAAPVVLVLDDLHWADLDALGLLRHVVRLSLRARLLVVGTYRDPDPDRARDPHGGLLNDALAGLAREVEYQRIVLRGFGEHEVAEYLAQAAGQPLPQALARAVHVETAGHPFFTREVFRHLIEERKLFWRDGRWSSDFSMHELGIPAGVRQVVQRRLSRLSPGTGRVLRVASALGGVFDFEVLRSATGLPEETLLECLDEALSAGLVRVVEAVPARYDFAHAIVRHAVYGSAALSPDRRARLHRQIAEALEPLNASADGEYAGELAFQYHVSARLGLQVGAERGAAHALAAADLALAQAAPDRAAVLFVMARDLSAARPAAERAEVLVRLTLAQAAVLALTDARATADAAETDLLEAGATPTSIADFMSRAARALKDGGADPGAWEPLVRRGLAHLGSASPTGEHPRDLVWARLSLLLDRLEPVPGEALGATRWAGHNPAAVTIARTFGDEEDYARTLEKIDPITRPERDELLALARRWRQPFAVLRALGVVANDLISRHGAGREAVEHLEELLAAAERYGSIPEQTEALVQLTLAHAQLGQFAAARAARTRAQDLLERLGPGHRLQTWRPWLRFFLAELVDFGEPFVDWSALAAEAHGWVGQGNAGAFGSPLVHAFAALAALAHARAGEHAQARALVGDVLPLVERLDPRGYLVHLSVYLAAACAWELNEPGHAPQIQALASALLVAGVGDPPTGSNLLAFARTSALMGQLRAARNAFDRVRVDLEAAERPPLRAMVDLDEAIALTRAGSRTDAARAVVLAEQARSRFVAAGMRGWADRAQQVAEGAASGDSSPAGLTPREVEVLRLIAAGRTTREVAETLVVSLATVERHITNLYAKIGARGRADATAYALGHGLAN